MTDDEQAAQEHRVEDALRHARQEQINKAMLDAQRDIRRDLKCLSDSIKPYQPYLDAAIKAQTSRAEMMKKVTTFLVQWSVVGVLTFVLVSTWEHVGHAINELRK
jgi:hypothetical protein